MSVKPIFLSFCGVSGLMSTAFGQAVSLGSGLQEAVINTEWLASNDIKVSAYSGYWSWEGRSWDFEANITRNTYDIEYEPTILGDATDLNEKTWSFSGGVTRTWNKQLSSTLSGRHYVGYSDYRSIWIAEFYRQLFGAVPEYFEPDPEGYGASFVTTWRYLPGLGELELTYDFGRDTIAPGWSFNPQIGAPAPAQEELDTHSGMVRIEQVLATRLKSELAFGIRDTTDRDPRYWGEGHLSASFGELGIRLGIGYAEEAPEFEAFYGGVLVEWGFSPSCAIYTGYRLYSDTGELENAGFNVLAPELDSSEVFLGLRYDTAVFSANILVGMLDTDYDAIPPTTAFFGELYRKREWWNGRISLSYKF